MPRFTLALILLGLVNCNSNSTPAPRPDASRDSATPSQRLDSAQESVTNRDGSSGKVDLASAESAEGSRDTGLSTSDGGSLPSSDTSSGGSEVGSTSPADVASDRSAAELGSDLGPTSTPDTARDTATSLVDASQDQAGVDTAASASPSVLVGFGTNTPGGAGGSVIKVTSLDAQGEGSLGAALAVTGPRIIVFEVGGVIDLAKGRYTISEPFVTLAGETAPSPGITIIKGGLTVKTHDVIIRHIRVRMGDADSTGAGSFESDVTTTGANAYNIVFDHVSVSWGVDENLSVSGDRFGGPEATSRKVTISNSIIAEGLDNSVHTKGAHSMGTLIHDYCTDVAVIGNLYIHNNERNPWFKGFATGVIVNNLIYNPGKWAIRLGFIETEWAGQSITPKPPRVSIVGNIMRHGSNTLSGLSMVGSNAKSDTGGYAFLQDNLAFDKGGAPVSITQSTISTLSEKPSWPDGLVARPAASTEAWVLDHSGARPKDRDATDIRLVEQVKTRKGAFIDSQSQVGGYPSPTPTRHTLDVPATNIDAWLASYAAQVE